MRSRNALPALDLLVGFESAARHLSFTKAGEELYLTQSAVSRQIKDLEDQLGVRLFERSAKGMLLTRAGQQFMSHAHSALHMLQTGVTLASGTPVGPPIAIRVGAMAVVAAHAQDGRPNWVCVPCPSGDGDSHKANPSTAAQPTATSSPAILRPRVPESVRRPWASARQLGPAARLEDGSINQA